MKDETKDQVVEKKPSRIITNRSHSEIDVVASLPDLLCEVSSPASIKRIVLQNLSDKSNRETLQSGLNAPESLMLPSSLDKNNNSELENRLKKDLKQYCKKFITNEITKLKEQLPK